MPLIPIGGYGLNIAIEADTGVARTSVSASNRESSKCLATSFEALSTHNFRPRLIELTILRPSPIPFLWANFKDRKQWTVSNPTRFEPRSDHMSMTNTADFVKANARLGFR